MVFPLIVFSDIFLFPNLIFSLNFTLMFFVDVSMLLFAGVTKVTFGVVWSVNETLLAADVVFTFIKIANPNSNNTDNNNFLLIIPPPMSQKSILRISRHIK